MVFRQQKGHAYKVRISNKERTKRVTLTTGSREIESAQEVEAFAQRLRDRKRWDVINALIAKRISLSDAYDAHENGTLDALMLDLATPDLDQLVEGWEDQGANKKYVRQVRRMIPEGIPFPASRFTRKAVSLFLASLKVQGPTKNRYRTALSQFAKWLVERDVLESNIVRDVAGKPENDPRCVWYEWEDAKRLIAALPEPFRSLEALMAGTGMEWQAIESLKRRDVDLQARTVRAHGHKNRHRNRLVRITEEWTLPIIANHVQTLMPNAPLFTVSNDRALDRHQAAVKALGLESSTLHDWRHTYAVNNLQAGLKPQVVKRQLGHAKNSTMVERIYGVWIVDERDYELSEKSPRKSPRVESR